MKVRRSCKRFRVELRGSRLKPAVQRRPTPAWSDFGSAGPGPAWPALARTLNQTVQTRLRFRSRGRRIEQNIPNIFLKVPNIFATSIFVCD